MSRKKTFIKHLSSTDLEMLNEGWKNGKSASFRNRCQCILMSHKGFETKQLQELFSASPNTIYTWLNKWKRHGIIGLITKPGQGRKPIISIENKHHAEVVETAVKNAAEKGTNMQDEIMEKLDLSQPISKRTLRRTLKKKSMLTKGFVKPVQKK